MQTFLRDLFVGLRVLRRNPGLTVVAVISLALGIGANVCIFTLVNALFLHALPVSNPARLMIVYTLDARNPGYLGQSYPNYKDYRDLNQVFSGLTLYSSIGLGLAAEGDPQPVVAQIVTANYFDVLGVKPILGRTFTADDDRAPGISPVAVISHELWVRKFGANPNIQQTTIRLNNHRFTIVGVAPTGFQGPNLLLAADVWVPMMMYPQIFPLARQVNSRRGLFFTAVGLLKAGVSRAQAEANMRTVAGQLAATYPRENEGRSVTLTPIDEGAINPNQRADFVRVGRLMSSVVGLVLLIACINVANLLLARAGARRKEIAVRISLGASRGRVIRQLMTESMLLALLGGAAGGVVAWWGRALLWSMRPPRLRNVQIDLTFDPPVLLFTLGLALATGIIFGLAPALQTTRTDLVVELKERTSQFVGAPHLGGLRNILVVGQVALSLVALIGAGLFLRSLNNEQRIDPGFETRRALVLTYDLGTSGYNEARGRDFHQRILARVLTVPGVQAASLASIRPFGGGIERTVVVEGQETANGGHGSIFPVDHVSADYFHSMSIGIVKGRAFSEFDNESAPRVAVVNQAMARFYFPKSDDDAIGKRFRIAGDPTNWQIVGVARDTAYADLAEKPRSIIYVPLAQAYNPIATLHVRTAGDPAQTVAAVTRAAQSLDPDLLLRLVRTMPQLIDESLWAPRTGATLLSCFGIVALALAVIGIYGVISFSVNQRVRDIGIRMALGATQPEILREVLRDALGLASAGVAAGIGCALLVTRLLSGFLFGVSATDPETFAIVSVLLLGVAAAACVIPARRATQVQPSAALRHE